MFAKKPMVLSFAVIFGGIAVVIIGVEVASVLSEPARTITAGATAYAFLIMIWAGLKKAFAVEVQMMEKNTRYIVEHVNDRHEIDGGILKRLQSDFSSSTRRIAFKTRIGIVILEIVVAITIALLDVPFVITAVSKGTLDAVFEIGMLACMIAFFAWFIFANGSRLVATLVQDMARDMKKKAVASMQGA